MYRLALANPGPCRRALLYADLGRSTTFDMDILHAMPRSSIKVRLGTDSCPRSPLSDLSNARQGLREASSTCSPACSPYHQHARIADSEQLAAALQACCNLQTTAVPAAGTVDSSPRSSKLPCMGHPASPWLGHQAASSSPHSPYQPLHPLPKAVSQKHRGRPSQPAPDSITSVSACSYARVAPCALPSVAPSPNLPSTSKSEGQEASSIFASPASSFGNGSPPIANLHSLFTCLDGSSAGSGQADSMSVPGMAVGESSADRSSDHHAEARTHLQLVLTSPSQVIPASTDHGCQEQVQDQCQATDTMPKEEMSCIAAPQVQQPSYTTPHNGHGGLVVGSHGLELGRAPDAIGCSKEDVADVHSSPVMLVTSSGVITGCGEPMVGRGGLEVGSDTAANDEDSEGMVFARSTCKRGKASRQRALLSDADSDASPQSLPHAPAVCSVARRRALLSDDDNEAVGGFSNTLQAVVGPACSPGILYGVPASLHNPTATLSAPASVDSTAAPPLEAMGSGGIGSIGLRSEQKGVQPAASAAISAVTAAIKAIAIASPAGTAAAASPTDDTCSIMLQSLIQVRADSSTHMGTPASKSLSPVAHEAEMGFGATGQLLRATPGTPGSESPAAYTIQRTCRVPQSARRRIVDSASDSDGQPDAGVGQRRLFRLSTSSGQSRGQQAAAGTMHEPAQTGPLHATGRPGKGTVGRTGTRRGLVISDSSDGSSEVRAGAGTPARGQGRRLVGISDGSDDSPAAQQGGHRQPSAGGAGQPTVSWLPAFESNAQVVPVTPAATGRAPFPGTVSTPATQSLGLGGGRRPEPAVAPSPAPWSCFKPVVAGRRHKTTGTDPQHRPMDGQAGRARAPSAQKLRHPAPSSSGTETSSTPTATTSDSEEGSAYSPSDASSQRSVGSATQAAGTRGRPRGAQLPRPPLLRMPGLSPGGSSSSSDEGNVDGSGTLGGLGNLLASVTINSPKRKPNKKPAAPAPRGSTNTGATPARPTQPAPLPSASLAAAPKRPPRLTPQQRQFIKDRDAIAKQLYDGWNASVFRGALPSALPLVFNPRLVSTAGQVIDDGLSGAIRSPCRLELSPKILTTPARLRCTLAHEMCHVAAWVIDREYQAPHGPAFWRWADALMAHDLRAWEQRQLHKRQQQPASGHASVVALGSTPTTAKKCAKNAANVAKDHKPTQADMWLEPSIRRGNTAGRAVVDEGREEEEEEDVPLNITRLHNYDTHQPYRWQCTNTTCNKVYQRHRNTIDTVRHVCSRCKGALRFLGKFNKANVLVAGPGMPPATPGGAGGAGLLDGGVTPSRPNQAPSAYREYVKTHYTALKAAHPPGTPMTTIMKVLGAQWTTHKQQQQQRQANSPPRSPHSPRSTHLPAASPRSPKARQPAPSGTLGAGTKAGQPAPKASRSPQGHTSSGSPRSPHSPRSRHRGAPQHLQQPAPSAAAVVLSPRAPHAEAVQVMRTGVRAAQPPVLLPQSVLLSPKQPAAAAPAVVLPRRLVLELSSDDDE